MLVIIVVSSLAASLLFCLVLLDVDVFGIDVGGCACAGGSIDGVPFVVASSAGLFVMAPIFLLLFALVVVIWVVLFLLLLWIASLLLALT